MRMDVPPDHKRPRQDSLERWLAEQRETDQGEERFSSAKRWSRHAGWKVALNGQRIANRLLGRGLDTSSHVRLPEHDHPDRVQYIPSAWHVLPRALRYLSVSDQDVFVDFGCGKGRVLHQAAKRPFRKVLGVEISPELAEIARANLARRQHRHRCQEIEIVVSDVADFRIPDDLTIGFFFHSFKNETLDALLGNIIDSIERHPRRVRLIYVFPLNGSQVLATGRFRLLKEQWTPYLDTPGSRVAIYESR
jgi:SAM-dependent methyltransferase